MPEINATLITQELDTTIEEQKGSLNVQLEESDNNITGVVESNNLELTGVLSSDQEIINTSLSIKNSVPGATLNVHYGVDGKPGKDGFSPTISVYKETKKEYILEITNKDGSFLTPNLIPDMDVVLDVSHKVDKDLTLYDNINPTTLTVGRREETLLYAYDTRRKKPLNVQMSEIALDKEVNEKIRKKLQTVTQRPEDWEIGDYIFLELQEESD